MEEKSDGSASNDFAYYSNPCRILSTISAILKFYFYLIQNKKNVNKILHGLEYYSKLSDALPSDFSSNFVAKADSCSIPIGKENGLLHLSHHTYLNFYEKSVIQWFYQLLSIFQYFKIQNELCSILIFLQNNNNVFTGSNDGSIGIWRVRNNFDKSPDSEMSSSSWHMSSEAGQSAGGGFLTPPVQFSSPVRRPSNSSLSRLMSRSMTSSLTRL